MIVDSLVAEIGADRRKCLVVYNAVDVDDFKTSLGSDEAKRRIGLVPDCRTVSLIANLRPEKNRKMFLKMGSCVLDRHPNTRFLIIGDGPLRAEIEAQIKAMEIGDQVRLLGIRSDIPELLAATDVSVLTSEYEGLSNTLLESMCAGVSVVTTDFKGIENVLTHGQDGFVVPCGDAKAMAEKIGRLLRDPALRRQIGETAKKRIEAQFSLKAMADSLCTGYQRLFEEVKQQAQR